MAYYWHGKWCHPQEAGLYQYHKNTLVVKFECLHTGINVPAKGSIQIERPDKPVVAMDFGDGSCDNDVLVSMNGRSRTVTVNR